MKLKRKRYDAHNPVLGRLLRHKMFSFEEVVIAVANDTSREGRQFYAEMEAHNSIIRNDVYFTKGNAMWCDLYRGGAV